MDQRHSDNEMKDATAELPTSVAELHALALEQNSKLEQQSLFIDQLLEQIRLARVQVLRHVRKTYACKACDGNVVTAPMPNQLVPRSLASPGTLAHVAVAKYVDGLPLYRQEKKLARIGVQLPRSTLAHWMVKAGELVQPLVNLLRDRLLAYDIVAMDETRLQVLKEPGKRAES
jgi:transposase